MVAALPPTDDARPVAGFGPDWRAQAGFVIVKVGGALLTCKSQLRTPDEAMLRKFAAAVRFNHRRGSKVIFVAGGGSFGNAQAHSGFAALGMPLRDIIRQWRDILSARINRDGPIATVIPARDLWMGAEGGAFNPAPIQAALACGQQVVLTGDLLERRGGRTALLSSDTLPIFLARHLPVAGVAMITGAPGLMHAGRIVPRIDDAHAHRAVSMFDTIAPDATGGMALKLRTLGRLAASGIPGRICGADALERLAEVMSFSLNIGTYIAPRRHEPPC